MPAFLPPRRGVRISQAYAEAAVSAPVSRVMLHCYELWHPSLAEPVRVVNDVDPMMAKLEASAPRDPGQIVEFLAAWVEGGVMDESEAAASPEIQVQIGNVSGLLRAALDEVRGDLEPWELIERVYASDDLSGPAQEPVLQLTVTSAAIAGAVSTLTASFGDEVNIDIPSATFTPEEYPGLMTR